MREEFKSFKRCPKCGCMMYKVKKGSVVWLECPYCEEVIDKYIKSSYCEEQKGRQ